MFPEEDEISDEMPPVDHNSQNEVEQLYAATSI